MLRLLHKPSIPQTGTALQINSIASRSCLTDGDRWSPLSFPSSHSVLPLLSPLHSPLLIPDFFTNSPTFPPTSLSHLDHTHTHTHTNTHTYANTHTCHEFSPTPTTLSPHQNPPPFRSLSSHCSVWVDKWWSDVAGGEVKGCRSKWKCETTPGGTCCCLSALLCNNVFPFFLLNSSPLSLLPPPPSWLMLCFPFSSTPSWSRPPLQLPHFLYWVRSAVRGCRVNKFGENTGKGVGKGEKVTEK